MPGDRGRRRGRVRPAREGRLDEGRRHPRRATTWSCAARRRPPTARSSSRSWARTGGDRQALLPGERPRAPAAGERGARADPDARRQGAGQRGRACAGGCHEHRAAGGPDRCSPRRQRRPRAGAADAGGAARVALARARAAPTLPGLPGRDATGGHARCGGSARARLQRCYLGRGGSNAARPFHGARSALAAPPRPVPPGPADPPRPLGTLRPTDDGAPMRRQNSAAARCGASRRASALESRAAGQAAAGGRRDNRPLEESPDTAGQGGREADPGKPAGKCHRNKPPKRSGRT